MNLYKIRALFIIIASLFILNGCESGPCDYPDDIARDGSRCGGRAASERPGGRNPDMNKILYGVLFLGGAVFIFNVISNTKPKTKLQNTNTLTSNRKTHKTTNNISSKKESMLASMERILWEEFDYKIDEMFIDTFKEIAISSEQQGYTPSDGAILYMLSVISMLKPSLADQKTKLFVHNHISTCERLLPLGNLPKIETKEHLTTVKSFFEY